jgi:hypothetical protein
VTEFLGVLVDVDKGALVQPSIRGDRVGFVLLAKAFAHNSDLRRKRHSSTGKRFQTVESQERERERERERGKKREINVYIYGKISF